MSVKELNNINYVLAMINWFNYNRGVNNFKDFEERLESRDINYFIDLGGSTKVIHICLKHFDMILELNVNEDNLKILRVEKASGMDYDTFNKNYKNWKKENNIKEDLK